MTTIFLKKALMAIVELYLFIFHLGEYCALRAFRCLANKIVTVLALRIGINIYEEKNQPDTTRDYAKATAGQMLNIEMKNPNAIISVLMEGVPGLARTYVEGWWDTEQLEQFLRHLITHVQRIPTPLNFSLKQWILANGGKRKQLEWAEKQRADSTSVFTSSLGKYKAFFHGTWDDANNGTNTNLDEAQLQTMHEIGLKLKLSPGMRVLDLGCGYGYVANYLASTFQVEVIGCTYSKEEAAIAKEGPCKIVVSDYRELKEGKFDRIVCLHLLEHIGGPSEYKSFFRTLSGYLKDDGLILLQTTVLHPDVEHLRCGAVPENTLFHSGISPLHQEILKASSSLFSIENAINHGANMAKTYQAFKENLELVWANIFSTTHDPKIYRAEKYGFSLLITLYEQKKLELWQFVFSKYPTCTSVTKVKPFS